jgi:hypothetical protein
MRFFIAETNAAPRRRDMMTVVAPILIPTIHLQVYTFGFRLEKYSGDFTKTNTSNQVKDVSTSVCHLDDDPQARRMVGLHQDVHFCVHHPGHDASVPMVHDDSREGRREAAEVQHRTRRLDPLLPV